MKLFQISKSLFLAFVVAIPAASFAAPASKNPQRHTQAGRFATTTAAVHTAARPTTAAIDCSGCTTPKVTRRGGKATPRATIAPCSGCPTMAAGGSCL